MKKEYFNLKIKGKNIRFVFNLNELDRVRQFEEKQEQEMHDHFRPFVRQYREDKTINQK